MSLYRVTTTATVTEQYMIAADSADGARQSLDRGEWEHYRDLGHEDCEVIEVEEVVES